MKRERPSSNIGLRKRISRSSPLLAMYVMKPLVPRVIVIVIVIVVIIVNEE